MPRWGLILGVLMLGGLQWRLWLAPGGLPDLATLRVDVEQIRSEGLDRRLRNLRLESEVRRLEDDTAAIEYYARMDLGMIKRDETFYLLVH